MQIVGLLAASLLVWLVVLLIAYRGARLTWFSSLALSLLVWLLVLYLLYPPGKALDLPPSWPLLLYTSLQLVAACIVLLYVLYKSLTDRRDNRTIIVKSKRAE